MKSRCPDIRIIWFILVSLAMVSAGCAADDEYATPLPPESPGNYLEKRQGTLFRTFSGIPVTQEDLDLFSHLNQPPDELAQWIALRRKLAILALEQGLAGNEPVRLAWVRANSREWLENTFKINHTPDTVPLERWAELYSRPYIRPRYDHYDLYFVIDAQIICCVGSGKECRAKPHVQTCLNENAETIQKAYGDMLLANPRNDAEFQQAAEALKSKYPKLAVQRYSFQYDYAKPHSKQRGYELISESVAQVAKRTPVGQFAEPVSTFFGWHIVFVISNEPERHLGPSDPQVLADMKQKDYSLVLHEDSVRLIQAILEKTRVTVDANAIRSLDWGEISDLNNQ